MTRKYPIVSCVGCLVGQVLRGNWPSDLKACLPCVGLNAVSKEFFRRFGVARQPVGILEYGTIAGLFFAFLLWLF